MPLIAGMLNFAWEILALIKSGGYWIHIVWLLLDCFIIAYNFYILTDFKRRITYGLMTLASFLLLFFVFKATNGMLISSFAIDVIMAVEYLVCLKFVVPQ